MSTATLNDLLYQPLSEDKLLPEWYDHGVVISKRVGDRVYEVWANGIFSTTSPDGNRFKGCDSAHGWLSERNVTDDHALEAVLSSEAGWDTDMSRWFQLFTFRIVSEGAVDRMLLTHTPEIHYKFQPEVFVDMINDAIESDAQEVEA